VAGCIGDGVVYCANDCTTGCVGAGVNSSVACAGGWAIVASCPTSVGATPCDQGVDKAGAPVRCKAGGVYLVPDCSDCHP
jgi:hypothetical protein